jgi:hypothetical protein
MPLTFLSASSTSIEFNITNFQKLPYPIEQVVEIIVQRAGSSFYFGTIGSTVDNVHGLLFLNPNEAAYQLQGNSVTVYPTIIGTNAALINQLGGGLNSNNSQIAQYAISAFVRIQSPLITVPTLQPILSVNSVTGNQQTGVVPPANTTLIYTQDFLLNGGSQIAADTVEVSATNFSQQIVNLSLNANTVQIDTAMAISVDANNNIIPEITVSGQPLPTIVVRSKDLSTVYVYGTDYTVSRTGRYSMWSLVWLSTGSIPAPSSANPPILVISYYKYALYEQITFISGENATLTGVIPYTLANTGFIYNVWLPLSYGNAALAYDGYNSNLALATGLTGAQVPWASRYIKVTLLIAGVPVVMIEGKDFTLTVDENSGTATIARNLNGAIPSGATVQISYFINETFSINTQYPAFVEQLITAIDVTKSAGADVLVKAMVANSIDMTLVIQLAVNVSPDVVDAQIRDIISIVLDNVPPGDTLYMAEVVSQIMTITGVQNVQLPLLKFAKSNGSYDIGVVIPTQTVWTPLSQLAQSPSNLFSSFKSQIPANSYITAAPVLPDATIPGGGLANAYVGLLYQGQSFRRASSVQDFFSSTIPSFYFIGTNDSINSALPISGTNPSLAAYERCVLVTIPGPGSSFLPIVANPSLLSFFATFQVWDEGGAKDITTSSTEYFLPGDIVLNYVVSNS